MQLNRAIGLRTAALALVVYAAVPAYAQVDMTGPWSTRIGIAFGGFFDCTPIDFVQSGTSLTITGSCAGLNAINVSGTIDPVTGVFSGTGTGSATCALTLTNGMANLNQRTFTVGFQCTGGPFPLAGSVNGFRCGNNVIDAIADEDCDLGDRETGDCCSASCEFDPPGRLCFYGDSNQCTSELCDGAGTCTSPPRTGPCDDDNQCTEGDTCIDATCTGTALPDGSACNDFNSCTTDSCQAGTCATVTQPDGAACDDGYDCQSGETCLAGECQIGADVVCDACLRCQEGVGCVSEVNAGQPQENSVASVIQLKKADTDLTKWQWVAAADVDVADFGDPAATGYEICVFDTFNQDPLTGYTRLLFGASLPPGSEWKATSNGFRFKSADKRLKLRMKAGSAGQAKIVMRAKGPAYGIEYLPPIDTIEARLRTLPGIIPGVSFSSYYPPPFTSTATKYKAFYP